MPAGGSGGISHPNDRLKQSAFSGHWPIILRPNGPKGQVIVATYSEGARERLSGLMDDEGVGGAIYRPLTISRTATAGCFWRSGRWSTGFEAPGLTVISEQDVLGDRLIRAPKRKRRAENFLTEANSLSPGDSDRACRSRHWPLSGAGSDHRAGRAA